MGQRLIERAQLFAKLVGMKIGGIQAIDKDRRDKENESKGFGGLLAAAAVTQGTQAAIAAELQGDRSIQQKQLAAQEKAAESLEELVNRVLTMVLTEAPISGAAGLAGGANGV